MKPTNFKEFKEEFKNKIQELRESHSAQLSGGILAGIMIMIIGFATLLVGNYIVFAIQTALPVIGSVSGTAAYNASSAAYNSTSTTIAGYVTTVMPLFGLALMVLGFALILWTLRTSMSDGGR